MNKYLFLVITSVLVFAACKKKPTETEEKFDKAVLLANVSDEIIRPRYTQLQHEIDALSTDWNSFKATPDATNLASVQSRWLSANILFQKVKTFNFGPALNFGLNASFGTFPTDTAKIISNANSANPNLTSLSNLDAIGFPALEYLFYRNDALNSLTNEVQLREYIDLVINKMQNEIDAVLNAWTSAYAATFKNATGTETTSGFSLLINTFNQDFELAKNAKLGIPIGKQSLGIPQMNYEEAPFSNSSLMLLEESLKGIFDLYKGIGKDGVNRTGFEDYLLALDKGGIDTKISQRFSISFNLLNQLGDDLALEVQNNMPKLDDLYANIQGTVVHIKTDMTSAFGVLITYQDNDGD